jgi:hypothetical protein
VDAFEIAIGGAAWIVTVTPVTFVRAGQSDVDAVFGFVFVENGVAIVVTGFRTSAT